MSDARAPSAWQIEKAMAIANDTLGRVLFGEDEQPTDAADLLALLKSEGADIGKIMQRLLLAATEAKSNADAIKARVSDLGQRRDRMKRHEASCRAAALSIMSALPECFPDGKFRDALVEARVGQAKPGIVVTDPSLLEDRFFKIERTPMLAAIAEAINDGEVIEGASVRNGAPFITIRTS
jgi:hypothetical protein